MKKILNAFYDEIQRLSSIKPHIVNPDNHDANCDNGGSGAYHVNFTLLVT